MLELLVSWNWLVLSVIFVISIVVLFRRRKSDSSEKRQSEESDKYLPSSQLAKETGREDDIPQKATSEASNGQVKCVSEQNEVEEREDLRASKTGGSFPIEYDAKDQSKSQQSSNEQVLLCAKECAQTDDEIVETIDKIVEAAQNDEGICESEKEGEVVVINEKEEEVTVTNEIQIIQKTNNDVSAGDVECSLETKYDDTQPGKMAKVSDAALSEAVDDILGALDDVLLKENDSTIEIRTVDISLSKTAILNNMNNIKDEIQSPFNQIPEIVVTEVEIETLKEACLDSTFNVEENSLADINMAGEDDNDCKVNDSLINDDSLIAEQEETSHSVHTYAQEAIPDITRASESHDELSNEYKLNDPVVEQVPKQEMEETLHSVVDPPYTCKVVPNITRASESQDELSNEYKLNDTSINDPVIEQVPKQEMEETLHSVQFSEKNEKRRSLVLVEKFSEKLSNIVIDTVLYKPDSVVDRSEEDLCKFSNILADSIVRTVLDYSKFNQDHIAECDENYNFAMNIGCMDNEADDNTHDDSLEDLIEDNTSSFEETDDNAPFASLGEYAKKLSEQILTNVLNEQGEHAEYCSAEVYISKLTETVIANAINSVKHTTKCCSITKDEDCMDTLVSELVQNVLKSAISRMGDEMDDDNKVYQNGHIDEVRNDAATNGKFHSKWLSEDDLDELYESDDDKIEDTSLINDKVDNEGTINTHCLINGEGATVTPNFLRPHDGQSNKEQSSWRKSLIDDLDEDLEFDEEDSPCGSQSDNLDAIVYDSSEDEEVVTPTAKAPPNKTSISTRSRLRSVDSTPALVFDNGSGWLKVGYSDESTPREIIPSVVGVPLRYSQDIAGIEYSGRPGLVFGDMAVGKAGVLHNEYPLKAEVIEKWSDIEGLWNYVLSSLMSVPEHPEFPVLLTQPALNSKKNTEKLAEIMFEKFHIPSLFIASQPALALFSMGYTSGLSFCSGFNSTQAAVVYEGHVIPHTVRQLDIAGYQVSETLKKLLMSGQGFGFRSSSQWKIVNDIKKKMSFVSTDFEADVKNYKTQAHLHEPYELPDGQVIEVGSERFGCAETLFRPQELGLTQLPAHMLITEAIQSCDEDLQELCYKAIGISGGTTLMKGFPQRLENELRQCDWKCKNLIVPEHRDLSTWLGGSIIASLPTFTEMVVGVDEYADVGARIVHSKCF